MTVSISRSRPITGSMVTAFCTRSSLNCSNSFVVVPSFFPFRPWGTSNKYCSVWVNKASASTPQVFSSSPAPLCSVRAMASSTWAGSTCLFPCRRASRQASLKIRLASGVKPWGRGSSGFPTP